MKATLPLALLLGPVAAHAAENLQPMVVTGTGYPVELEQLPASMEVISRDEIENSTAYDLGDLLRFHSGLEIGRNGGPGQATSLFVRGTNSNHVLIMVDGVPVNAGSTASAAIQNIDPQTIEQVEIYKGPHSTLWGSGAMGGVVNIITSHPRQGLDWGGSVEAGGNRTRRGSARLSWADDQLRLGASLSHDRTDGFPTRANSNINRGYQNTTFNLLGGLQAGDNDFELRHWQTQGMSEYLSFFGKPLDQDFLNSRSSFGWTARFIDRWQSKLLISRVRDHVDQNQSTAFTHTDRNEIKWENDIDLFDSDRLVLGYKYGLEKVRAQQFGTTYNIASRIDQAWAQYDLVRGPHRLIAGIRYLDHEDAGKKTTWSLNYGYDLNDTTQLFASAATAFRAPDANERYGFAGNPALKPEESASYEIGFRYRPLTGHRISGALYRNDLKNLIQWTCGFGFPAPGSVCNQNVGRSRIDGLELSYDYQGDALDLHLGGNWQNPVNRDTGQRLLRRARYAVNARAGYRWRRLHLGADLLYSGDRMDFGGVILGSYTLVNLNASFQLTDQWQLFAKVENAFDRTYMLANGFNTAGRTGYIGIRYR